MLYFSINLPMITNVIFLALVSASLWFHPLMGVAKTPELKTLASRQMSLEKRYRVESVNEVFKDNILLNIAYMQGLVKKPTDINWGKIEKPFTTQFVLQPGEIFAFHDDVLPTYAGKVKKTTHAHFNAQEGFKSDGYLYGDGVCHLASLISWAASDAHLGVVAPTNHNFMPIPQIPKKFGVAIYSAPGESSLNQRQNLYVKNTYKKPIAFVFDYKNEALKVSVVELN